MNAAPLTIVRSISDNVALLVLNGSIDLEARHPIRAHIRHCIAAEVREIAVDLASVAVIDTAGLGVLLACRRMALDVHAGHTHGIAKALQTALGIGSIVVAWLVVHTTFTLRYAKLYHEGEAGGVDFNGDAAPSYADFAYIAFTIGMTFQVSDTSLTSSTMRSNALRHALLSYLFGTVIIATSINIVAGLAK